MTIIYKLKKYGIYTIFKVLIQKTFQTRLMKIHYLKIKIDLEFLELKMKNFDLNVKELTYDDFLLGDKNVFFGKKMEVIKLRFNDPTYKGYGIIENGTLIYSAWISLEKLGLPVNSNINLTPKEGYLEDDYCHPNYRGRGIHSKMILYRMLKLFEYGKNECVVTVIDGNLSALNAQLKLGARDLGCFYAGKFLGIDFVILNKKKYDSR